MATKDKILSYLERLGSATGRELCDHLGITRQALSTHIRDLLDRRQIIKSGSTRNARYFSLQHAPTQQSYNHSLSLKGLDEDIVYEELAIRLNLSTLLRPNAESIVHYAFTEMLNNAIDHSVSERCKVSADLNVGAINFEIRDYGIGVFHSIADNHNLEDEYAAMIELVKGKTTTKPEAHTGEGIFFTARAADRFVLRSHRIQIEWNRARDDVFVSELRFTRGTTVSFTLLRNTPTKLEDVFLRYAPAEYDYQFKKSSVLVKLLKSEYISRSEAKRLMANLEKFGEIELDFKDVTKLGQGFADEVFRVFTNRHPSIKIQTVRLSPAVGAMIQHARSTNRSKE